MIADKLCFAASITCLQDVWTVELVEDISSRSMPEPVR